MSPSCFVYRCWCVLGICICSAHADISVVAHPDAACEPKHTLVWTDAIQSAFDRVIGEKAPKKFLKVAPPNLLFDNLRAFKWQEAEVLPKDGWFAVSGESSPNLALQSNTQWRALTGMVDNPFRNPPGPGLVAYVGLNRDFIFKKEFIAGQKNRLEWGTDKTPVQFFGVNDWDSASYTEGVRVLGYMPATGQTALQLLSQE